MIYDRFYDKGKEKKCWSCGKKTRNAIMRYKSEDEDLPICLDCILKLHYSIAGIMCFSGIKEGD